MNTTPLFIVLQPRLGTMSSTIINLNEHGVNPPTTGKSVPFYRVTHSFRIPSTIGLVAFWAPDERKHWKQLLEGRRRRWVVEN